MNRFFRKLLLTGLTAAIFAAIDSSHGEEKKEVPPPPPPIRALLVTGGASHDYETRKEIIAQGIRERVGRPIEWVVRFQGAGESDVRIPLFEDAGWATGYDIVVHDYCFPRVRDSAYVDRILAPHRAGLPAVLVHGTMQSFRTGDDRWFDFCGATSRAHGKPLDFKVEPDAAGNPIVAGMLPWSIPRGELYRIERLHPGATPLTLSTGERGEKETTSWSHLYGPAQARVFATTLGNETSTLLAPPFLDMLAKGFLWALGENGEGAFVPLAPEKSLSKLSLAPAHEPLPKPGPNHASRGRTSAMSIAVTGLSGSENAIDGDPETYWEAGMFGPTSWQVDFGSAREVGAILLTWKSIGPPRFQIESSLDALRWQPVIEGEGRGTAPITVGFDPLSMRFLRVTIPETKPGEVPGIREVAAYGSMELLPAAFPDFLEINGSARVNLASAGVWGAAREVRLAKGWSLAANGSLPEGAQIVDLIPAASGNAYLLVSTGEKDVRAVYEATLQGDRKVEFREVIGKLASGTAATWDGEWIYTLYGPELVAYRDTDGDGRIDDRSRVGRLFSSGKRTSNTPITFRNLKAGPDAWFYATIETAGDLTGFNAGHDPLRLPRHGLVRFRRNGDNFHVVATSPEPIDNFQFGSEGAIFIRPNGHSEPAIHLLTPLAGTAWRDLPALSWPPSAETDSRWRKLGFVTDQDRLYASIDGSAMDQVAEVVGLKMVADDGARIWFVNHTGGRDHLGLITSPAFTTVSPVDWDRLGTPELFPYLASPAHPVRTEAVYEVLRRKYRPVPDLGKMLGEELSPAALESVLATLSATTDNRALDLLTKTAASPAAIRQALAFRHLADHPSMRNHVVFGEISKTTVPEVTAAILSAMERTGTSIPGLDELVLSFAANPDPELAATARAFLQARGASAVCFEHLENEENRAMRTAAFSVLRGIHRVSVVEGIVLLLEKTGSAEIRALGLDALVALYYDDAVNRRRWEGTPVADLFLRASLLDHRVDRPALLRHMIQAGIPEPDPEVLVELGAGSLPLEAYAVGALDTPDLRIPANARPWLETVVKSTERDPALRAQALGLMVGQGGKQDYRKQFEAVAGFADFATGPESAPSLIERWLEREDHSDQTARLIEQTRAGERNRAALAWATLARLLEDKKLPADTTSLINARIDDVLRGPVTGMAPLVLSLPWGGEKTRDKVIARLAPEHLEALDGIARDAAKVTARFSTDEEDGPQSGSLGADSLYAMVKDLKPDLRAGRALFNMLSCGDCHNIHGEGPSFGPDLGTAARQRSKLDLIKAIISPSLQVTPGYEATAFELTGGRRVFGYIEARNDLEITLRDRVGNPFSILREAVKMEWPLVEGTMVCEAASDLPAADFASLLGYLETLAE